MKFPSGSIIPFMDDFTILGIIYKIKDDLATPLWK
jgi:hypothetical protein